MTATAPTMPAEKPQSDPLLRVTLSAQLAVLDGATKHCTKCGVAQALDAFYRSKTGTHGRHAYCKACASGYAKERWPLVYAANKQTVIAKATAWNRCNKERVRERINKRRKEDPAVKAKRLDEANKRKEDGRGAAASRLTRERMAEGYVKQTLAHPWSGITKDQITPELLALKREHLAVKRAKKTIHNALKELHESSKDSR